MNHGNRLISARQLSKRLVWLLSFVTMHRQLAALNSCSGKADITPITSTPTLARLSVAGSFSMETSILPRACHGCVSAS
ncbi:MAG: hypothetical protein EBW40_09600, partial [Gammaproteobacteria bacterium]|nr:hypothetical protein [Gammaproteobacteria bacterium]